MVQLPVENHVPGLEKRKEIFAFTVRKLLRDGLYAKNHNANGSGKNSVWDEEVQKGSMQDEGVKVPPGPP